MFKLMLVRLTCLGSNYAWGLHGPDFMLLINFLHTCKLLCTCVPEDKKSIGCQSLNVLLVGCCGEKALKCHFVVFSGFCLFAFST